MPVYNVKAVEVGLTTHWEPLYLSKEAISSFPNAFNPPLDAHYMHPTESLPYPPIIGNVKAVTANDTEGFAQIDFTDDFSQNFEESKNVFDVSIYCNAKQHYDSDMGVCVVDEFIYASDNSIDVVDAGAVVTARVLDKADGEAPVSASKEGITERFIRCSLAMSPVVQEDAGGERKDDRMKRQEILDAIKEGFGEDAFTDSLVERIAASIEARHEAEPPAPTPEAEPVDEAALIVAGFKAGCVSGFDGKSIERVAASIQGGMSAEDAVAQEQALIDEFTERISASAQTEKHIEANIHPLIDEAAERGESSGLYRGWRGSGQ